MGQGLSQLTEEQIEQLKKNTPFEEKDLVQLLGRYAQFKKTEKDTQGVEISDLLHIPEFSTNPILPNILPLFCEEHSSRLSPESFIYLCAALSSKTPVQEKRELAFRCFDRHSAGHLQLDDIFHLYKLIYGKTLTENQILSLAEQALDNPDLEKYAVLTKEEFNKFITDMEIEDIFTIDLQYVN